MERDMAAALERRLLGLENTPDLAKKILKAGGKRKAKKKIILSVVLAVPLILSTGAFANG